MQWLFPTAPDNQDAMQTAWYRPTSLAAPPSGRSELVDDEDEDGLKDSVSYVESLIEGLISRGTPPDRIVVGGFSQGCAVALLTQLTSQYSGRLAGVAGLMGYLPLQDRIQALRTEKDLPHVAGEVHIFVARGEKDMMIPRSKWNSSVTKLKGLGISESALEVHEYQELGHSVSPQLLRDLCTWLEKVVPPME